MVAGYAFPRGSVGTSNQHLLARPVERLINENTLVALALLVAESEPAQKALMIRLIEHFILLKD